MSPIRVGRAALYGKDWKAFSESIRFGRAKGRCECRGECGATHETGRRASGRCPRRHGQIIPGKTSRVVLTVAHLCHDETCREHVKAMCQRCHLTYDAKHHARNAAVTRAWIRTLPCFVCTGVQQHFGGDERWRQVHPTEAAHVKSRGAGGADVGNTVPLCTAHHQNQHLKGMQSFCHTFGIDLKAEAEKLAAEYGRITADGEHQP